jgi:single-strand DNA-binding protein
MVSFNKTIQAGNLTRDPELRFTPDGIPVCEFGIAVNRVRSKQEDAVDFFDVSAWRELGEIVQENKKKGHGVLVTGRLAYDQWKNAEGEPRSKVKVVADAVQFTTTAKGRAQASGKAGGRSYRSGGNGETNATATATANATIKKQYQSRYSK